jgi:hypothetical protein
MICEVQLMLPQTHAVRERMHELYHIVRAQNAVALYQDCLSGIEKQEAQERFEQAGETPLGLACRDANLQQVTDLLCGPDLPPAEQLDNALKIACVTGKCTGIIQHSAFKVSLHRLGWELLMAVCQSPAPSGSVVRSLVATGVDVCKTSDRSGESALYWAARMGHADIVSILLEYGADANVARLDDKMTPLLTAAYNGHGAVVSQLIAAGADTSTVDCDGTDALYQAAKLGFVGVVALLLANEVSAQNYGSYAASLEIARQRGFRDVCAQLEEAQ